MGFFHFFMYLYFFDVPLLLQHIIQTYGNQKRLILSDISQMGVHSELGTVKGD